MSRLLVAVAVLLAPGVDAAHPVRVAPVVQERVDYVVRTYGVLAPTVEEISFPIPGRIAAFEVAEGDAVRAGQELARLETRDRADRVQSRRLELDGAERELSRMRTLHAQGSVPKSMLDDAQAARDLVAIEFESAREAVRRSIVRAPADGVVLEQRVDSRTNVAPGEPVFLFRSAAEPWITEVGLTDRNAHRIGVGARAEVRLGPWPDRIFTGSVTRLARVADPGSGLFLAEIAIDPAGAELRPGMIAEVDLRRTSAEPYSVLPFEALLEVRGDSGIAYLLPAGGDRVRERAVTIHSVDGSRVAVEEELGAFEAVVVRGQQRLRDGAAVRRD